MIPRRALLWVLVAGTILLLGLAGLMIGLKRAERLAARQKSSAVVSNDTASMIPEGFEVSEITLEKPLGANEVVAVGNINNTLDKKRSKVAAQIDLFDLDGRKIGSVTAAKEMLEPNGQWRFQVPVVTTNATSARLVAISEQH
jgi:hypothetical protein